ncbi:3-galactosyl-N-acetylglucosaminide 4-alpha-L-fucosyltransferase FUT3-like [Rhineura floridana]|uniref:3-galactosyl-N-acetylglucosaminide 4-alpha-L-fucosyltransferase FUT3-like n=1 Tax=Rhineura floridana TaxID=261503 RepID=UPI002AC840AE|nr:3-galactosyl-N-acetylglucosaminide 4-alpha-L-fucosyltransferase FUT3-like [Rhineura floridana]
MDSNVQVNTTTCRKLLSFLLFQIVFSSIVFTYVRNFTKPEPETTRDITQKPLEWFRNSRLAEKEPSNLTYVRNFTKPEPETTRDITQKPSEWFRNSRLAEKEPSNLTLLLWAWPFGARFDIQKCSKLLGIPDCHITANRSWYSKADAVIVHHRDACSSPKRLPQDPRPPFQCWIWFNLESPSHSPNLGFMDGRFNLTMSYRRDSDIFTPYGWLEVLAQPENVTIPPKSKLVAWVVSNWNPGSRRVRYYEELKKHIHVDVFGHGRLPLSRDQHLSVLSQYKFYLAFENSIHEDYITEKLWKNSLLSGAVPVVCGPPRKNYERYLPPSSFIHIDDFPTAEELANFLKELDRNTTRYHSYFLWRSWLKPVGLTFWNLHFCKACLALQKKPIYYQTVPELSKWYK